ncbi:pantoate--beta-alanine ligase [Aureitalea marina]|uniref:Pantothenate synthetase n=1 Tax=Aureitalea marina TaxID=930804 RepID=A0A2S7KSR1_9FLAO|nr:pantoate--beta-alanine ligase [Aureitalea marina]PQB05660.1 pantoate--beta-alanine ligase [Aureitalea marina]
MELFSKKLDLAKSLTEIKAKNGQIGLVPTMGALHPGHLSLVQQALDENEQVVVSIFVNPTQFDNPSDLNKYPRDLEGDLDLLSGLSQNIWVYNPEPDDLYDGDVRSKSYDFGALEQVMEGRFRQGHFDGVGSVLNLLFRAVSPNRAYFGEKDYQQLLIVKELTRLESLDLEIVGCPIYREPNGLAMSSRNKRLSEDGLQQASLIYQSLLWAKDHFDQLSIAELKTAINRRFELRPEFELEYFEIATADQLETVTENQGETSCRGFIAAFLEGVRLIDNMGLN